MKTPSTKHEAPEVDIQGPAVITDDHVQDRVLNTRAGSKVGWSRLTVFQKAHRAGKLMDPERCKGKEATKIEAGRAVDRFEAGTRFAEGWKIANTGNWAAASDLNRVRAAGCPGSFADLQIDVKNFMRALECTLGTRDWMILRRVCGENCQIAETVTDITPGYRATTLTRFREALDALIEAIPAASRKARGGK